MIWTQHAYYTAFLKFCKSFLRQKGALFNFFCMEGEKMGEISIPNCITDKLRQLNQLAERYPENIPVSAAADFLGMDGRSLKSYLMQLGNPVGMGWRRDRAENRAFHIPTAKFYTWYRNLLAKGV